MASSLHCASAMKLRTSRLLTSSAVLPLLALSLAACPDPDPDGDVPCPNTPQVEQRNPDTGICEIRNQWDCDMGPGGPAPTMEAAIPWAACYTACEQLDEAACDASEICQTAYIDGGYWGCWETSPYYVAEGACGELGAMDCATREDCNPNYSALEVVPGGPNGEGDWSNTTQFEGCTADTATAPGSCYGEALCDGLMPDCPDGTLPGIADSCWTGYCIPLEACEPAPSCDAVGSEGACISRDDCAPLYQVCGPAEFCPTGYKYWGCTGA